MSLAARHQTFHDRQQRSCCVIPNPWDRGSARMMGAIVPQALTVAELAAVGVWRISGGSQIARLTHAAIRDCMAAMLGQGSLDPLMGAASGADIDALLLQGTLK